jgi:cysteinyl-tRNA synthetase
MLKSDISDADKFATIMDFDRVLGLGLDQVNKLDALPEEVQKLIDDRQAARVAKDWARSDQLRDAIQDMGYAVQDAKDGMKVIKK